MNPDKRTVDQIINQIWGERYTDPTAEVSEYTRDRIVGEIVQRTIELLFKEHPRCRPPARANVIAAFDLDTWGDSDDGEPHHAFLCATKDDTSAIAYVAACNCAPSDRACPRARIMIASRVSFASVSIVEIKPPKKPKRRK